MSCKVISWHLDNSMVYSEEEVIFAVCNTA